MSILILASDPISPSRCFPIVQLLSPSWSCDSPGSSHTATPGHTSSPHPAPAPPPASAPPPRPPLPRPPPRAELCRAPVSPGAAWEGLFREGVYIYSSVPRRASISCAERQPRQLAINIQPPATSSRNTELHIILLHGDIQQYLVH